MPRRVRNADYNALVPPSFAYTGNDDPSTPSQREGRGQVGSTSNINGVNTLCHVNKQNNPNLPKTTQFGQKPELGGDLDGIEDLRV